MKDSLNVNPGQATDIMAAQDICRGIASEYVPLEDNVLDLELKNISDPFISNYIKVCNNNIKEIVDASAKIGTPTLFEIPKVETDSLLFDKMMEKYKGKVVYVDFWATWCGPCRAAIKRIAPLKEKMNSKNVAFVYISSPTSPEGKYKNMINNITGNHYKASNEEWKILTNQFNVKYIPHYVLVGKDGEIISKYLDHLSNDELEALFEKHM